MSVFVNKETTYLLTLITMQNLTAVCVDMCRGPKIGGNGARPFGGGDIDPQNTRFFLRCVTMLNLIVLGQRIWTTIIHYGHKILSHAKPGVKSRNLGATELLQPVEPPLLLCLLVFEQKMMVMMIMQNKNQKS